MDTNYAFTMFAECVNNADTLRIVAETNNTEDYYLVDFCEPYNNHENYIGDNGSVVSIDHITPKGDGEIECFATYEEGFIAFKNLIKNTDIVDYYVESY